MMSPCEHIQIVYFLQDVKVHNDNTSDTYHMGGGHAELVKRVGFSSNTIPLWKTQRTFYLLNLNPNRK